MFIVVAVQFVPNIVVVRIMVVNQNVVIVDVMGQCVDRIVALIMHAQENVIIVVATLANVIIVVVILHVNQIVNV